MGAWVSVTRFEEMAVVGNMETLGLDSEIGQDIAGVADTSDFDVLDDGYRSSGSQMAHETVGQTTLGLVQFVCRVFVVASP